MQPPIHCREIESGSFYNCYYFCPSVVASPTPRYSARDYAAIQKSSVTFKLSYPHNAAPLFCLFSRPSLIFLQKDDQQTGFYINTPHPLGDFF